MADARRDDVLGHVTAHVSRAAVHLGRVLAAERAAAVPAHAAVAVHDDFAPGQPGVALRPADDETAGGVDEKLRLLVEHDASASTFLMISLMMKSLISLCFTSAACWVEMTTLVMRTGLPFSYWTETWVLASGRSQATLPVLRTRVSSRPKRCAIHDRRGHQFRRFIAGVAKHQALVAGALLGGLLAFGGAGIHALGDVRDFAT